MTDKMNPDFPVQRGCWLDKKMDKYKEITEVTVYDYPTWHLKNGDIVSQQNPPIPDGKPASAAFKTLAEAVEFCRDNNYVICERPRSGEKRGKTGYTAEGGAVEEDQQW